MYERAMYERSNGIGLPNSVMNDSEQVAQAAQVAANVVDGGRSYMQRLTEHFKDKRMTTNEVRRIKDERYDPASPDIGLLEGSHETGKNCCTRKDELGGSGVGVGVRCTTYECCETYEGECKWRSCCEPSLLCMYMSEHRVQVRETGSEHEVPKSVLIRGCMNKDAQAEADNAIVQKI